MNKTLFVVGGPTASGKTKYAIALARAVGGEVVSADSMQIYKGMDIGTAKPSLSEREGVVHHMIDVISPFETFSVKDYADMALNVIERIFESGKQPILVGGTGLYISSLIDNIKFVEAEIDCKLRDRLLKEAKAFGNEYVHEKLKEFDYDSYLRLHPNNLKRIIRAIEIYKTSGLTMTEQLRRSKGVPPGFDIKYVALTMDRQLLYDRIDRRVDIMISEGLAGEVAHLKEQGLNCSFQSMQGIGYKEIFRYLENEYTLDEAIQKIKQESRRYAKRQLTWFRKDNRIKWLELSDDNNINENLEIFLEGYS